MINMDMDKLVLFDTCTFLKSLEYFELIGKSFKWQEKFDKLLESKQKRFNYSKRLILEVMPYKHYVEEKLFKSDFKHVVHYLRQIRMGKERNMLPDPLDHAPELLTLLKALSKDDRYDDLICQAKIKQKEGEIMTFPSLFEDAFPNIIKEKVEEKIPNLVKEAEKRAEERGIASGIAIGTAQTEARVQEERQIIRDRLIASGIPSQEAAVLTGLSV